MIQIRTEAFCNDGISGDRSLDSLEGRREVHVQTTSRPSGTTWSLEVSFDNMNTWSAAGDAVFTFRASPQVSAAIPTSGVNGGDTLLTVYGANFYDNKDLRCRFGAAGSTRAIAVSANVLLCGTPASITTGVKRLDVTNNNQDYSTTFRVFRYYNTSAPYEVRTFRAKFEGL